jgi:hypothetical protein
MLHAWRASLGPAAAAAVQTRSSSGSGARRRRWSQVHDGCWQRRTAWLRRQAWLLFTSLLSKCVYMGPNTLGVAAQQHNSLSQLTATASVHGLPCDSTHTTQHLCRAPQRGTLGRKRRLPARHNCIVY